MVSFDSATPGTSAATWARDPRLHDRPPLQLDGVAELVVIAAHPDDETLGAGGMIARCSRRGIPIHVIVVTDGAASNEVGIAARRSAELRTAVHLLAPRAVVHELGVPDGQTLEHQDRIRALLTPHIAACHPQALVVAPWRGDGHRDHRVVGEIVAELTHELARRLVEYPVWLWHWGQPASVAWESLRSVGVDTALKSKALAAFRSQIAGSPAALRADFLENFARDELFIVQGTGIDAEYFESLYARHADPWGFETRWYERRKRALLIASLPDERYGTGLEIGCSLGHLTEVLAGRCDDLLAVDISAAAVEAATARLGGRARIERRGVLDDFPAGRFDLVVLSEVGYYFGRPDLDTVLDSIEASLTSGGTLVACHWRHPVSDYPLGGDEVHRALGERAWARIMSHVEDDFILEVFAVDPRSVGQRTGLA